MLFRSDVQVLNYPSLAELSKDYVAGKILARANLTLDAVNERLNGFDQKIVMIFDYSNGSDTILTRQDIKLTKDLKGKRVACELGTLEEFFLKWALAENGLQPYDVTIINATPENAPELLKAGTVDVAVSYEPFASKLISGGGFHVLYSSRDAPGLITDVLTFPKNFVEDHPDVVQAIVTACFRGVEFWKEHPAEANAIIARRLNDTPENAVEQLKGVMILDARGNESAFTFSAGIRSLYGNLRQVGKFVNERLGKEAKWLDTDTLVEKKFVKSFLDSLEK